jgi:molybdopterin molybdotransferase
MIPLDAARALLLADVTPLEREPVALRDALGRVLAEQLVARNDQPALPVSAMDGFAVMAADAVAGARLMVIGEAYAGTPFAGALAAGQAVRIATGGVLPRGADQVVMQEVTRREQGVLVIEGHMGESTFVRPAGGDFRAGDLLLDAGQSITAARVGLAAAASVASLKVRRRPRVAIFASGDELREPGSALAPGEVANSAAFALAALVEQWGGIADRRAVLPDDQAIAGETIDEARDADLLLFIGGASVGDRDVLRAAVEALGATILFDRIAVQPGKPSWHARFSDGRLLLGLPGNPVSAFVCAHLLLEPLLAALLARPSRCQTQRAQIATALPECGARETWWRARLTVDEEGRRIATPDLQRDSSLQRSLAAANALLRQPAGRTVAAGDRVGVLRLLE